MEGDLRVLGRLEWKEGSETRVQASGNDRGEQERAALRALRKALGDRERAGDEQTQVGASEKEAAGKILWRERIGPGRRCADGRFGRVQKREVSQGLSKPRLCRVLIAGVFLQRIRVGAKYRTVLASFRPRTASQPRSGCRKDRARPSD